MRSRGTQGPRRVSKRELHDAFAKGWTVESIEPVQAEARPDLKDSTRQRRGRKALVCRDSVGMKSIQTQAAIRNPMISGVMCILLGEAILAAALPLLVWLALFVAVNTVYIPLVEEPGLVKRFGRTTWHTDGTCRDGYRG